jgi:hypothetical protein
MRLRPDQGSVQVLESETAVGQVELVHRCARPRDQTLTLNLIADDVTLLYSRILKIGMRQRFESWLN